MFITIQYLSFSKTFAAAGGRGQRGGPKGEAPQATQWTHLHPQGGGDTGYKVSTRHSSPRAPSVGDCCSVGAKWVAIV